jgi:hypothetical protein
MGRAKGEHRADRLQMPRDNNVWCMNFSCIMNRECKIQRAGLCTLARPRLSREFQCALTQAKQACETLLQCDGAARRAESGTSSSEQQQHTRSDNAWVMGHTVQVLLR